MIERLEVIRIYSHDDNDTAMDVGNGIYIIDGERWVIGQIGCDERNGLYQEYYRPL